MKKILCEIACVAMLINGFAHAMEEKKRASICELAFATISMCGMMGYIIYDNETGGKAFGHLCNYGKRRPFVSGAVMSAFVGATIVYGKPALSVFVNKIKEYKVEQ